MLMLPQSVRIKLFVGATDMRKGFDGLSALVAAAGEDVFSGHLYVFVSRRRDRAKILSFHRGGFVLWYKRLEQGTFKLPSSESQALSIDAGQLAMLLDTADFEEVHRSEAWAPKK